MLSVLSVCIDIWSYFVLLDQHETNIANVIHIRNTKFKSPVENIVWIRSEFLEV